MNRKKMILASALMICSFMFAASAPHPQEPDPDPPGGVVKLIFIHHSTGENWLADGYGNLGKELGRNNYFVSDTNYGWGPDAIGDRTDIPNWIEWFSSSQTPAYMNALFNESGQHAPAEFVAQYSDVRPVLVDIRLGHHGSDCPAVCEALLVDIAERRPKLLDQTEYLGTGPRAVMRVETDGQLIQPVDDLERLCSCSFHWHGHVQGSLSI